VPIPRKAKPVFQTGHPLRFLAADRTYERPAYWQKAVPLAGPRLELATSAQLLARISLTISRREMAGLRLMPAEPSRSLSAAGYAAAA
jgi:hypothetical protein